MEQKKRGRKVSYEREIQAIIIEEYYTAPKEKRGDVLEKWGTSIPTIYRWLADHDVQFFVKVNGGETLKMA